MKKRKPDDNIIDGVKAASRMSVNTADQQVQEVKTREIQLKRDSELVFVLFFFVIFPSSPTTIHRGWGERS